MRGKMIGGLAILFAFIVLAGAVVGAKTMLAVNDGSAEYPPDLSRGLTVDVVEVGTLSEAEAVIDAEIPLPTRLPAGYRIQRVFANGRHAAILLSDVDIVDPPAERRGEPTRWEEEFSRPGGIRLLLEVEKVNYADSPQRWVDIGAGRTSVQGEVVDLGQVKGLLIDPQRIEYPTIGGQDAHLSQPTSSIDDLWHLVWFHSELRFDLKAPKKMGREQVIDIAASVPVLSSELREVSIPEAERAMGLAFLGIRLPQTCEIQRVFLWGERTAYLLVSETEISMPDVVTESKLIDLAANMEQVSGLKMVLLVDTDIVPSHSIDPHLDLFEFLLRDGCEVNISGKRAISHPSERGDDLEWFTERYHCRMKTVAALSLEQMAEIMTWEG